MPILKGLALLKGIQKKLSFSYEVVGIRSSCYCCMQLNVISKERLCCDSWLPGGIHVCFLNGVHDQLLLRLSFLILMASSKIFVLGILKCQDLMKCGPNPQLSHRVNCRLMSLCFLSGRANYPFMPGFLFGFCVPYLYQLSIRYDR